MARTKVARTALAVMCGLVIAASAAAQTNSFDIPEGDLKVALEAYARQSGVRLVYLSEDVRDRRTAGARGDMSQDAALNRLLAGTGLTVKRDQSGALAIVREGANTPTPTRNAPSSGVGQAGPDAYNASLSGGADASTPSTASPTTFDAVQVTGSHIKRAQMSGVGPTTVIDAETIQSSGAVSVET
ncbi:STN domain-containing protein, partial [Xanthomonas perforans]